MKLIKILSVFIISSVVNSERILALWGLSSKSHNNMFTPLTLELAARGHDLTVVTAYPIKNTPKNYRQIETTHVNKILARTREYVNMSFIDQLEGGIQTMKEACPGILKNPEVKKLLDEKFDFLIISGVMNDCCVPFAYYYNAPFIFISPNVLVWTMIDNLGVEEPASYVPNVFLLPYSDKMTFLERFVNSFVGNFLYYSMIKFFYNPMMNDAAKEFFGPDIPLIEDISKNVSLALINSDSSWNFLRPLQPNIIEIGGIQMKPKNDPLPKDIQEFLDNAKDGAIYFSMGSILRGDEMPKGAIKVFLETFASLPKQRILWKWESDNLPGQPKNVKLGKWLPQQDILAHPNVKLFITHGGLLSTQETVYYGVPLVGIPIFGDQPLNMRRNEELGFAKTVELKDITKDKFLEAIQTVLSNKSYSINANKLKNLMRDQLQTPMERAVYWTEYVIRQNGAPHLRSSALKLQWFQLYLLDIIGTVLIVIIIFILFCKQLYKFCFKQKKTISHNKKKN